MINWPAPPARPTLAANEIHVWSASLDVRPEQLLWWTSLLDQEELARAGRYVHLPSRRQYIVARGLLRVLLGRYLDLVPMAVRFTTGPQGKPLLASPGHQVHFNVSHSNGLALIAVTHLAEIGVDVEHVRPQESYLDMATRFFSPGEAMALRRLTPERSAEVFFHVWTRKEAFLKAVGLGLSHGLERFEVSVPPDDPARILHIDGDRRAGDRWSLTELVPSSGYIGALAVEKRGYRLRCWSWDKQEETRIDSPRAW